ncbi:Uncharacterised protein [Vibrio cholerae]|nr:Uncharacterised protein [Vibrio cholerae]
MFEFQATIALRRKLWTTQYITNSFHLFGRLPTTVFVMSMFVVNTATLSCLWWCYAVWIRFWSHQKKQYWKKSDSKKKR